MAELSTAPNLPLTSSESLRLKLANSLLSLPSRLWSRMRRVDELLDRSARQRLVANLARHEWDGPTYIGQPPPPTFSPLPGPWGFLTSGYAVGLFVMVSMIAACLLTY
jgi:hypothetical protein